MELQDFSENNKARRMDWDVHIGMDEAKDTLSASCLKPTAAWAFRSIFSLLSMNLHFFWWNSNEVANHELLEDHSKKICKTSYIPLPQPVKRALPICIHWLFPIPLTFAYHVTLIPKLKGVFSDHSFIQWVCYSFWKASISRHGSVQKSPVVSTSPNLLL